MHSSARRYAIQQVLFGILLLNKLSFATEPTAVPVIPIIAERAEMGIKLTDWLMLGPFSPANVAIERVPHLQMSINVDYIELLSGGRFTESGLSSATIKSIASRSLRLGSSNLINAAYSSKPFLDFNDYFQPKDSQCAYLVCDLSVSASGIYSLITGGRDMYRVFVNGILVTTVHSERWIEHYTDVTFVQLHSGTNTVVVKCASGVNGHTFSADLCSKEQGAQIVGANALPVLATHYLIPLHETLKVRIYQVSGGPSPNAFTITPDRLVNSVGTATATAECASLSAHLLHEHETSLTALPEGIYTLTTTIFHRMITEELFYGDVDSLLAKATAMLVRLKSSSNCELLRQDFETTLARLRYLNTHDNRRPERSIGETDAVACIKETLALMDTVERFDMSYRSAPGKHYRSFLSDIDHTTQCYVVMRPPVASSIATPLVIVYPNGSPSRPVFISSFMLDYEDVMDFYELLSRRYGFTVLFPFGRNRQYSLLGDHDVLEALASVTRDYTIDANKIYVMGGCAAGRDAMMLAARNPGLFAAVAIHMPMLRGDRDIAGPLSKPQEILTRPQKWGTNLRSTPVYISYGSDDRHTSVNNSLSLSRSLSQDGVRVTLDSIDGASDSYFPHINNECSSRAFAFFAGKSKLISSGKVALVTLSPNEIRSAWLTVIPESDALRLARCEAEFVTSSTLYVKTYKVHTIILDLAKAPGGSQRRISVVINGKRVRDVTPDEDGLYRINVTDNS